MEASARRSPRGAWPPSTRCHPSSPRKRSGPATTGGVVTGPGPRLTVAEGFARWIQQPEGRRSLDTLLACVPLARRGPARERILEWSHHAEVMFRELDLRAFAERALRR